MDHSAPNPDTLTTRLHSAEERIDALAQELALTTSLLQRAQSERDTLAERLAELQQRHTTMLEQVIARHLLPDLPLATAEPSADLVLVIRQLEQERDHLARELSDTRHHLGNVFGSRTWRYSAALRRLASHLRRR